MAILQMISPMLFGQPKSGKDHIILQSLGNERYRNRNVSIKAHFANYFSKLFVDFSKVDLSPKLYT